MILCLVSNFLGILVSKSIFIFQFQSNYTPQSMVFAEIIYMWINSFIATYFSQYMPKRPVYFFSFIKNFKLGIVNIKLVCSYPFHWWLPYLSPPAPTTLCLIFSSVISHQNQSKNFNLVLFNNFKNINFSKTNIKFK